MKVCSGPEVFIIIRFINKGEIRDIISRKININVLNYENITI